MSAIWGIVSLDRSDIDSNSNHMDIHYKKYCKIDRYQTIELPDIYMGCGIQHITNEANEECLPIYDEANDIIFNADCLLDNRQELCKLLNISLDRPDGHLMYNAYLKWGIQCVSRFRGLFSLAIYDRKKQELHLASDQLSCRSLYYYRSGNTTAFSTQIQPIRNLYPEIPVNENYLKDFLTAPGLMPNIVAHETPWLNVFQLNPGEYITLSKAGLARTSYWNPEKEGKYKKCKNARQYQVNMKNWKNPTIEELNIEETAYRWTGIYHDGGYIGDGVVSGHLSWKKPTGGDCGGNGNGNGNSNGSGSTETPDETNQLS